MILGVMSLAVVTAVACALPGVFVVLRRNSMLVDAIGHAILPGIVLGYWLTQDLRSPVLIAAAALSGLAVVLGSEFLSRTGLISGDAPQGLVFPALFSAGILLISANFANVHLDTHAVLVGDLNLAAFHQLTVGPFHLGPSYLWVMVAVLVMNVVFLTATYPRLKLTTFDPIYARTLGVRTGLLSTALMFFVSLTVTAAFHAVGAILVLALMIIPPATAVLVSKNLSTVLLLSVIVAVTGALGGFTIAYFVDAPTSAGMAIFYGLLFIGTLVGVRLTRRRRRWNAVSV